MSRLSTLGRYVKTCARCGNAFLVPGACTEYLFKHKSKFARRHLMSMDLELAEHALAQAHEHKDRHGISCREASCTTEEQLADLREQEGVYYYCGYNCWITVEQLVHPPPTLD